MMPVAASADVRPATLPIDEVEQARAALYRLLAATLSHPPDAALLGHLRALPDDADDSAIGVAVGRIARAAGAVTLATARQDYDRLFVGIARGELVPYASFYLTGFLHDRPLVRLRETLATFGLAAVPGHADPEDHAGTVCELMAGLIDGGHGAQQPLAAQRHFFERHMAPWCDAFFTDLEAVQGAELYASVGALGRALFAVERLAFQLEPS